MHGRPTSTRQAAAPRQKTTDMHSCFTCTFTLSMFTFPFFRKVCSPFLFYFWSPCPARQRDYKVLVPERGSGLHSTHGTEYTKLVPKVSIFGFALCPTASWSGATRSHLWSTQPVIRQPCRSKGVGRVERIDEKASRDGRLVESCIRWRCRQRLRRQGESSLHGMVFWKKRKPRQRKAKPDASRPLWTSRFPANFWMLTLFLEGLHVSVAKLTSPFFVAGTRGVDGVLCQVRH